MQYLKPLQPTNGRRTAEILLVLSLVFSGCSSLKPTSGSSDPTSHPTLDTTLSFALIGDMPYGTEDVGKFERLIEDVNGDSEVEWVLHVGDIKTGSTPCSDEYFESRLDLYQRFERPFVFIPGDNEWTDCHRAPAGGYQPLERLGKLRSLFYPEPGQSLGNPTLTVITQAAEPEFNEFPEHVRWQQNGVVFVGLHIVGSANGMAPFEGRTEVDDAEATRRMEAAVTWMKQAFQVAHRSNSSGVFLMIHANPGFFENADDNFRRPFRPFLTSLEQETIRFGKPVLLAHGDFHYFEIDKPLVNTGSGKRIENFTRVQTFGDSDVHWLKVIVDPEDENVFTIRQEIVRDNLEQHTPPE